MPIAAVSHAVLAEPIRRGWGCCEIHRALAVLFVSDPNSSIYRRETTIIWPMCPIHSHALHAFWSFATVPCCKACGTDGRENDSRFLHRSCQKVVQYSGVRAAGGRNCPTGCRAQSPARKAATSAATSVAILMIKSMRSFLIPVIPIRLSASPFSTRFVTRLPCFSIASW